MGLGPHPRPRLRPAGERRPPGRPTQRTALFPPQRPLGRDAGRCEGVDRRIGIAAEGAGERRGRKSRRYRATHAGRVRRLAAGLRMVGQLRRTPPIRTRRRTAARLSLHLFRAPAGQAEGGKIAVALAADGRPFPRGPLPSPGHGGVDGPLRRSRVPRGAARAVARPAARDRRRRAVRRVAAGARRSPGAGGASSSRATSARSSCSRPTAARFSSPVCRTRSARTRG